MIKTEGLIQGVTTAAFNVNGTMANGVAIDLTGMAVVVFNGDQELARLPLSQMWGETNTIVDVSGTSCEARVKIPRQHLN